MVFCRFLLAFAIFFCLAATSACNSKSSNSSDIEEPKIERDPKTELLKEINEIEQESEHTIFIVKNPGKSRALFNKQYISEADWSDYQRYQKLLIEKYSKALAFSPNDTELYEKRANCLWSTQKFDDALADYRRTLELQLDLPSDKSAKVDPALGRFCLYGKFDEALEINDLMISKAKDAGDKIILVEHKDGEDQPVEPFFKLIKLYIQRARIYESAEDYQKALTAYDTALEYFDRIKNRDSQEKSKDGKSLAYFFENESLPAKDEELLLNTRIQKAECFAKQKNYAEAARLLEQLSNIEKIDPSIRENLCRYYNLGDENDKFLRLKNELTEEMKNDSVNYSPDVLLEFNFNIGNYKEALKVSEQIKNKDPYAVKITVRTYRKLGKNDKALSILSPLIKKRNPNNPVAWDHYQRSAIYFEQKKFEAALQDLNIALKNRPHKIEHLKLRSQVYEKLGDSKLAQKDRNELLSLSNLDLGTNPYCYKTR